MTDVQFPLRLQNHREKLKESEERLIRSCEAANADAEVLAIERDWAALSGDVAEPWTDAASR